MTEEIRINGKFHNFRDELLKIKDKDEYEKTLEQIYYAINLSYHEEIYEDRFREYREEIYEDCFCEEPYRSDAPIPASFAGLLTESFMERHKHQLYFPELFTTQNMSEEFVERNFELLKREWLFSRIFIRNSFSEQFLDKHSKDFTPGCWKQIARWQKISPNFIRKHRDNIDPLCVSHTDGYCSPNEEIWFGNPLPTYSTQKPYYTYDEVCAIKEGKIWQTICLQTKDFIRSLEESGVNKKEILNMLDCLKQASKAICSSQEHTAKQR